MIKAIIKGMIGLLTYLVNILLTPINAIINQYLPNITDYVAYINLFLTTVSTYFGWLLDAMLILPITIDLIIAYYTAKVLAPLAVSAIKTLVRWWEAFV